MKLEAGKHYRTIADNKVDCVWNSEYYAVCTYNGVPCIAYNIDGKVYEKDLCIAGEWHDLPEGYTPWFGGECPVDGKIQVMYRHGGIAEDNANSFYWYWRNFECDVIGYKVIEDKPEEEPKQESDWWKRIQKGCPWCTRSFGDLVCDVCDATEKECLPENCAVNYFMNGKEGEG